VNSIRAREIHRTLEMLLDCLFKFFAERPAMDLSVIDE
jgi:hypothetical protein